MKRTLSLLFFLSVTSVTFTAATPGFGQAAPQTNRPQGYYKVIPLRGATVTRLESRPRLPPPFPCGTSASPRRSITLRIQA